MDFPLTQPEPSFPWRTAALVAAAVAAVELVVLVAVAGSSLLATADGASRAAAADGTATTPAARATKKRSTPATTTSLPRRQVSIVILNGNGRTGAASAAAGRVERRGYRITFVGNAPRQDYPSSLVMYRPGFLAEGRRLGRDLGIGLVSPLDGMRPGQLHGAHTVVILGG